MKKTILFILLTTTLFSQAQRYMGLGYNLYNEDYSYNNQNVANTSDNAVKFKIGYADRKAFGVEASFDYIMHSQSDNPELGKAKYGFNIALSKAFDWNIYLLPYLKAGFGVGIIDNRSDSLPSLTYGSFDLGAVVYFPFNDSWDIEIGYEYKYLTYENKKQSGEIDYSLNYRSHVNTIYTGVNFRF